MGFEELERKLNLTLYDEDLTRQALVHSSYLNENPGAAPASNERLEFLGDAVIGALVADYLYHRFPDLPEGQLTSLRAAVVRAGSLAEWAQQIKLGELLLLGKGEESHGGREREGLLAATFEALMAAIYLQHGYEGARRTLELFLPKAIESVIQRQVAVDAKSRLQHLCQAQMQATPVYRVVDVSGPPHKPLYTVEVLVDEKVLGRGTGHNKQTAEQAAAATALESMDL
ncbi:MAG: ribonuclease III [Chloroflexota bacterium]|jgi:ribonuclease-3